tara:strand:- start:276 stop:503 length:228 start_codon:yes stop_codon:yes gene_type:complete
MVGSTLKPDFKKHILTIKQHGNNKWSMQFGCPTYQFFFDTWEEMVAQLVSIYTDPEKYFIENKIEMGNKNLKPVR